MPNGIQLSTNFDLNSNIPLDSRTVVPNISARNNLAPSKVYQGLIVYVTSEDKYYYYNTSNQWTILNTGIGGSNNFSIENVVYTTGNLDIFDKKRFENATNLEGAPFLYSGLGKYTENYFYASFSGGSGFYNSPITRNSVVFLNFDKDGEYNINLPNISGSVLNDNIKYIISNTYKENISINFYDWVQAQVLTGDIAGDNFGWNVATNADGSVLMMGGLYNDPNGVSNAGTALIYTGNAANGWILKQRITGDTIDDLFGFSVATNADGSVLMMGGIYDDPNGVINAGAALIYTGNAANGWVEKQRITGDNFDDNFGWSVATNADGTVLMIGGRFDDPNGVINAGAALIYTGNAANGWVEKQRITGDNFGDNFGWSVATNAGGTVLMIGGRFDDPNGVINAGAALIYTGNAANGWVEKQRITGDNFGDNFGWSVATNADGSVLMMGGVFDDPNGVINAGAALIYTGNAANGWVEKQRITGDNFGDNFGWSVATNAGGTVLMIGGPLDDLNGVINAGAALIYTGNAANGWVEKQRITGDIAGDNFGFSVATNADGTVLMIGGPLDDPNGVSDAGSTLIYYSDSTEFLYQPDFTLNFKTSGTDENQNYTEPFNLQSLNSFVENDSISFYFDENSNWTILDKIQNNFLPEHSHEIEDIAGMPDFENFVYTTGNQTISGIKNFITRPTVNGTGVLLSGEAIKQLSIINTTYSTLTGLKAITGLVPGQLYRISDFHLMWYNQSINDTGVKSGLAPEPLIVLALSGNRISHEAKSEIYPQDTVYYDIDASGSYSWGILNNNRVIPNFKGWIYRRIDHQLNIDIGWDWRNITVNCCRPDMSSVTLYSTSSTYNLYSVVKNTSNKLYYSVQNSNTNNSLLNLNWWLPVSDFVEGDTYFSTNESFGFRSYNLNGAFINLPADQSTRIQQPTFTSSLTSQGTFMLATCKNIKIGGGFSNVIFGNSIYSNNIGHNFNNNTIGNAFDSNTIGNFFSENIIGNLFEYNIIENNFSNNTIGRFFSSNIIGNTFISNTIVNFFSENTIGNAFYDNTIGNGFSINIIGNEFYGNTIINNFNSNTIANDFIYNNIGNNFAANNIGYFFNTNTIGNNFRMNTLEDNASIGNVTGATHVYLPYNTRIFKNSNETVRLSYFNNSDQLVVTDPTA